MVVQETHWTLWTAVCLQYINTRSMIYMYMYHNMYSYSVHVEQVLLVVDCCLPVVPHSPHPVVDYAYYF